MRAQEFITESNRGKPEESFSKANPGAISPNGTDNSYVSRSYDMYRMSMLTGMHPDDIEAMDTDNWAGNRPVYHFYTDEEKQKHERAMKKLGHKSETHAASGSREMDDVQKVSPHTPFKGYKR
jgi:hypothetical protein